MKRVAANIDRVVTLLLIAIVGLPFISCEKKEPKGSPHEGVWYYHSSTPEIDKSYHQSYVEIFKDNSFRVYDSSSGQLFEGGDEKFTSLEVVVKDPDSGKDVTIKVLGIKDGVMTLRTDYFNGESTITLKRGEAPS